MRQLLGVTSVIPEVLYRLYEHRLLREVRAKPMPRHVGIILDGNRRYGREHGVDDPRRVYDIGARKLDALLEWCADLTVPAITLWVFSTANLVRGNEEVSGILGAIEEDAIARPRSTDSFTPSSGARRRAARTSAGFDD